MVVGVCGAVRPIALAHVGLGGWIFSGPATIQWQGEVVNPVRVSVLKSMFPACQTHVQVKL